MRKKNKVISIVKLDLHQSTLAMMDSYYSQPIPTDRQLTLEDAVRWEALDAWVRYKEYLANMAKDTYENN